jgi:hypothetical protein
MEFDIKRKKINIFKIGETYCFKQYFKNRELFGKLSKYYNQQKYRFEYFSDSDGNDIIKILWDNGYDASLVEEKNRYIVKIDRSKKYAQILKNSIEQTELGSDRLFLMKDMASVEQALEQGAEIYQNEIKHNDFF